MQEVVGVLPGASTAVVKGEREFLHIPSRILPIFYSINGIFDPLKNRNESKGVGRPRMDVIKGKTNFTGKVKTKAKE